MRSNKKLINSVNPLITTLTHTHRHPKDNLFLTQQHKPLCIQISTWLIINNMWEGIHVKYPKSISQSKQIIHRKKPFYNCSSSTTQLHTPPKSKELIQGSVLPTNTKQDLHSEKSDSTILHLNYWSTGFEPIFFPMFSHTATLFTQSAPEAGCDVIGFFSFLSAIPLFSRHHVLASGKWKPGGN